MDKPLVTIFTITRNRCELLPRAMKSILNQTYRNIEYIIIDSASTDNTEQVVMSFSDDRIRYVKLKENETFGHCINMAFHLAKGKYVTELDDDDEYHLDKIEKQVKLFETLPEDYGMVYCWMTYFDNRTKKIIKIHKAELRGNVIEAAVEKPTVSGTPTLLVRRDIFDKIGGYKEADEIGVESDWEFATRICKNYKVDYVPESLVNVYINHSHLRMSNVGYYDHEEEVNIKFHQYFLEEFNAIFEKSPKRSHDHLFRIACSQFALKRYNEFWKTYGKMLCVAPFKIKNFALPLYCFRNYLRKRSNGRNKG